MGADIYKRLRQHVNEFGWGYSAATTTGVELHFLGRVFTEDEAETYLHLTGDLETPEQIAQRDGLDPERLAVILQGMAKKGLVFPKRIGEKRYYAAAPAYHGLHEQQISLNEDRELAQFLEDYGSEEKIAEALRPGREAPTTFPLRTIPVTTSIDVSRPIACYEDAKEIIRKQDRIAAVKCVCAV